MSPTPADPLLIQVPPEVRRRPPPEVEETAEAVPAFEAVDRLPHKSFSRAQLILFAGKRDHGKTTAMRRYLRVLEPRVAGLDTFDDFDLLKKVPSASDMFDEMADGEPHRLRVSPVISSNSKVSSRNYGEWFFGECFDRLRNSLLALDEITLWSKHVADPNLERLVLQGRRVGIRMLVACQRIQLVPDVMLSEMTHLVIFRTTRPRDLDVIEEWAGVSARKLASKLKVGEVVCIDL